MIVVDYLSKYVKLIPCKSSDSSKVMAEKFKQHWHDAGFGLPDIMISDRDSKITSKFWKNLCQILDISVNLATARHQQTNGQVERTIRTVKTMLLALLDSKGLTTDEWPKVLSSLEFNVNDSISCSTGFTPFFLVFGEHPRSLGPLNDSNSPPDWTKHMNLARSSIQKAQEHQARSYNRHRRPSDIVEGDLVLLEREGINWSADSQSSKKLLTPWIGPFKVSSTDGINATLVLPPTTKVHNVFSVSKLKKYFLRSKEPAPDIINSSEEWEVSRVLNHRQWRKHLQYLVEFKGLHKDTRQWLFADDLTNCQGSIKDYLSTRGGVAKASKKVSDKPLKIRLRI